MSNNDSSCFDGARVLITGGLGMIGSTLAHYLTSAGAKVTILDALLPLYGGNKFNIHGIEDQICLHIGDIRDSELVRSLVPGQDFIFNLAAQVSYIDSDSDPLLDLDINCRGHLIVLEAVRQLAPKATVVFSGSRMQYGFVEQVPVSEDHPMVPLSMYGVHKVTGESYYRLYAQHHALRTIAFRLANPYGPRQQMKHSRYGIVNYFMKLAMDGQTIRIFGKGEQIRDYVFVDDVVLAMVAATRSAPSGWQTYNVGSGSGTRFIDMARMVVEEMGTGRIQQVPWPENYHRVETGDFVPSIEHLKRDTGWEPVTSLRDGIRKTIEFTSKHRAHYW